MCECGCGEFQPFAKFKAPDGWYLIEHYPGCDDCATPAGIQIGMATDEEVADPDLGFDGLPLLPFRETMATVPVVEPRKLIVEGKRHVEDEFAVEESITQGFAAAARATFSEWYENVFEMEGRKE